MAAARRKAEDRRGMILAHAAKLFRAQGYHATTMDDVADSVKLNKGTLYYYYESKANILFEMLINTTVQRLASMRDRSELEPEMAIRAFIEDTIDYLAEHPIEASVSFQEAPFLHLWLTRDQVQVLRARQSEFEQHAVDAVRAGQKSGLFTEDLDARLVSHCLVAIVTWFVRWYKPGGRLSAEQAAQQSSRLVLRGLLAPDQLHRLDEFIPPESTVADTDPKVRGSSRSASRAAR